MVKWQAFVMSYPAKPNSQFQKFTTSTSRTFTLESTQKLACESKERESAEYMKTLGIQ